MLMAKLAYASESINPITDELINCILDSSQKNNPESDITGLLCYSDSVFLQALEGPKSKISDLYNIIAMDDRHKGVTLLYFDEIKRRCFQDWSMGSLPYQDINNDISSKYTINSTVTLDDLRNMSGSKVSRMIIEISQRVKIRGRAGITEDAKSEKKAAS